MRKSFGRTGCGAGTVAGPTVSTRHGGQTGVVQPPPTAAAQVGVSGAADGLAVNQDADPHMDLPRTPTFFVDGEKQKGLLENFQRREQHLAESYVKNYTLCFRGQGFQRQHPLKAQRGTRDADVTLANPVVLGVADGVSQIEDFGIDASAFPRELLRSCESLAMEQLLPGRKRLDPASAYRGPIPLLERAFRDTDEDCLGSTTVVLALLDNSTKIHGKDHPMIAVVTVGDCQLLVLRRPKRGALLEPVFQTEMQRIDGHAQTPLQLARVDGRIDPDFDESLTIDVIRRGSAVHCVSAYEGDIVVLGSDGVFDNLFKDEIVDICNSALPSVQEHYPESILLNVGQRIVHASHMKSRRNARGRFPEAPVGRGGKVDDTSVVVAEVVEWSEAHAREFAEWQPRRNDSTLFLERFLPRQWLQAVLPSETFLCCAVEDPNADGIDVIPTEGD